MHDSVVTLPTFIPRPKSDTLGYYPICTAHAWMDPSLLMLRSVSLSRASGSKNDLQVPVGVKSVRYLHAAVDNF
jgi:hypothetical protein